MTGMAVSEGELIDGSVAMAAPVFREDGIVGAIAVIGPAFRCDDAWRARAGRLLQEAARTINAGLAEDRYPGLEAWYFFSLSWLTPVSWSGNPAAVDRYAASP